MPHESPIKVLFIGGAGRSGSTLLETVLGQIDGFVPVGEFNEIWKAGLLENRLCGCGRRFRDCDFWRAVLDASFGGIERVDVKAALEAQSGACRVRHLPKMIWPKLQSLDFKKKLETYRKANRALFEAIRRVGGARVIVDSSKTAAHAFVLTTLDNVELHVLQLVRDSRAVAHSWQRRKSVPDPDLGSREMVRKTASGSAIDWNLRNFLLGTLRRSKPGNLRSYNVLRYEDFTKSPMTALQQLTARLGIETDIGALFATPSVVVRKWPVHTLEGNPSKFAGGDINIRVDDEWKHAMRPLDRVVVSALTRPYLSKFGYL